MNENQCVLYLLKTGLSEDDIVRIGRLRDSSLVNLKSSEKPISTNVRLNKLLENVSFLQKFKFKNIRRAMFSTIHDGMCLEDIFVRNIEIENNFVLLCKIHQLRNGERKYNE